MGMPMSTDKQRSELQEALLYTYGRLNTNTTKLLETTAALDALIELLSERGDIAMGELEMRKKAAVERLSQAFRGKGMGVVLQEPEYDKYALESSVEIDCENRIHLCKAACCRLPFALSAQDIREGVVRWELAKPYMIEQGSDGYCNHLERSTSGCTIYEKRPVPCHAFNCSNDKRIWADFDKRIPNPSINRPDWLAFLAQEKEAANLAGPDADNVMGHERGGEGLVAIWRQIITDATKPWVLFQHGTVVVMDDPPEDVAEGAVSLMDRWGQALAGTPTEDFSVFDLGEASGWVVTRHFIAGFDILTYVSPTELADADPHADTVRQVGCEKQAQDATARVIVHIEDQRTFQKIVD